jgi:hypothetical protein
MGFNTLHRGDVGNPAIQVFGEDTLLCGTDGGTARAISSHGQRDTE